MKSLTCCLKLLIRPAPAIILINDRLTYRQTSADPLARKSVFLLCLLFLYIFPACLLSAATSRESFVSRMAFAENLELSLNNRTINESDVMTNGYLEPLQDGKFHPDWPISRAVAVRMLYLALSSHPDNPSFPADFTDIANHSVLFKFTNVAGGFFPAFEDGRFKSNTLISESEAQMIFEKLKNITGKDSNYLVDFSNEEADISHDNDSEPCDLKPYQNDGDSYVFSSPPTLSDALQKKQPHFVFNYDAANDAVTELETLINSLEINLSALSDAYLEADDEKHAQQKALKQILEILDNCSEKLRYTLFGLDHGEFNDSESKSKAELIRPRILSVAQRISTMQKRIMKQE
ncbi:MAG: hypothetical protein HQM10_15280 [Candidatus Riflebacteria bacterium]|nr:hypothetical protein [Candidatus Riflebacteria bacterium]